MERKYAPSSFILTGIKSAVPLEVAPWDEYFMAMAQTDFMCGRADIFTSKSYFIRKAPFGGSYAILGGLVAFLRTLSEFSFRDPVVQAVLRDQGYNEAFCEYLTRMTLSGGLKLNVYSILEGEVFFPNEPAIVIEGNLISVRIAEGILTRAVNFPTLAMTKWHRCSLAAKPGLLLEFARRRAQNAFDTSLYAHLGGADFTSNTEIRRGFDIPSKGTMGHEWIQSIGDEYKAFGLWLEHNPDKPVLLVDTINTLESGIPNAIKAFQKNKNRLTGMPGIRLDSGDLAYLAIKGRRMLDKAMLEDVRIFMTNDLDEYSITDIKRQIKEFYGNDPRSAMNLIEKIVWAAGTKPGTCYDQPSIGGVMKLTSIAASNSLESSVIKLARDNPAKCSIQGSNRVTWVYDKGELLCSLIHHKSENPKEIKRIFHPDDPKKFTDLTGRNLEYEVRHKVTFLAMGNCAPKIFDQPHIADVRERVNKETNKLHWSSKRLEKPHMLKVGVSEKISKQRMRMIEQGLLID